MRRRGQAVRAVQGQDFDIFKARVDEIWTEANEEHDKYYADQLKIIFWMIENDLPTRPEAVNQRTLLDSLRDTAEAETRNIVEGIAQSVQADAEHQEELAEAETRRLIAELLADTKPPAQHSDRARRGRRSNKTSRKPRRKKIQKTRHTAQAPVGKINKPSDENSQKAIQDLGKYLDFVAWELNGLHSRLNRDFEHAVALSRKIQGHAARVADLLNGTEADAAAYVELAQSSDAFLQEIRREMRALERQRAQIDAFVTAVRVARGREPMIYGRRHGGRLDRGLGTLSWFDVSDWFHNRWLGDACRLKQGSIDRFLLPDEALAYYVTTSSLSGYDFDISVHYWRRRPGYEDPPADHQGFMNTEVWYDTFVPCLVLHVPHHEQYEQ
ncbi:MAG: hypothetical protein D6763_07245 [Alphaproteobacteria bacterium]|nr:MAG: hypothetical protein D6763_07245 [Alphaproteobacteria bacterium]